MWDSTQYADGLLAYNAFATAGWANGLFGASGIFQYTVPPDGSPQSAYLMANQPAFVLPAIPEPSTLTFTGGLAFLLFLGRRRSCSSVRD